MLLNPWDQPVRSQQSIASELQPHLAALSGVKADPVNPLSLVQRSTSKPIDFVIMSQVSYPEMDRMVNEFMSALRDYPGLQNIDTDLRLNTPELRVEVQRDKLADVGVDVGDVGRTLESMMGGRQVTRFPDSGERYDALLKEKRAEEGR